MLDPDRALTKMPSAGADPGFEKEGDAGGSEASF